MSREAYQPGAASGAEVRRDGTRWTLVFVRELRHPPGKVWLALVDPSHLREWAPFDADRNLGATGRATLTMVGGPAHEALESSVVRAELPRLLEYTWGGDVLRWELEPTEAGTRLTLHHTLDDRAWLPKVAAGWHICLDVAERALADQPIGRIVAGDARSFGWERLNDEYARQFGIESTGWPEGIDAP
ncbi:MAG: SRPBCC family protein [Myxococcaceae bacterium]|nr:SRPBCC family protein [Myxococcaceae bacterium]MCI0669786.1 SRPBCC family protein [Myxococcaceae bacterium]